MKPNLLGMWEPSMSHIDQVREGLGQLKAGIQLKAGSIAVATGPALTEKQVQALRSAFADQRVLPVGVSGHPDADGSQIGSVRATAWSPGLAEVLWPGIQPIAYLLTEDGRLDVSDTYPTDWYALPGGARKEHRAWRAVGVSPVLRFMRYEAGGEHNTHYDMGYDYEQFNPDDRRRTLFSVVWYLSDCPPGLGGCTRFIEDGQGHLAMDQRDHSDWTRRALDTEVLLAVAPVRGHALVFPHRAAHDVQTWSGSTSRIIIRGDVIFEAV